MIKIVSYLIVTIISIISISSSIKMYKKSKTVVERVLYLLLLFVYFVPIIIYIIDKNDIPTKLGYLNNADSIRWFNFISTYVSTIVGTVISGVILVLITMKQINVQIDNSNNDKRIQNSPILNYSLTEANNPNCKYYHDVNLKEKGKPYHFIFKIENIGLNHCRNLNFKIQVDDENDNEFSLNKKQSFLKKDDFVNLDLIFYLDQKINDKRLISIVVYYDDMLNNRYEQIIKTKFIFKQNIGLEKKVSVDELIVENEKLVGYE